MFYEKYFYYTHIIGYIHHWEQTQKHQQQKLQQMNEQMKMSYFQNDAVPTATISY